MNPIKGVCHCGAISYELTSDPQLSFLWQCKQCQRITGTGHSAEFVIPSKNANISGELKFYKMVSDIGNTVSSGFCPTCGNPVLKKSSGYPGLLFFHAATLENPGLFKPQKVFWHTSHQPWDYFDPGLEVMAKT